MGWGERQGDDTQQLLERVLADRVRSMVEGEFDVREHRMTESIRRYERDMLRLTQDALERLDELTKQAESLVRLLSEATGVPTDQTVQRYLNERLEWFKQTALNALYDRAETIIDNVMYMREEPADGTDTTT